MSRTRPLHSRNGLRTRPPIGRAEFAIDNGVGDDLREERDACRVAPPLLRYLNERAVFEALRNAGPLSRTEIARQINVSMPTVSKAMLNLLQTGLVEELPSPLGNGEAKRTGRPGVLYGVARAAQVLGVEINLRRSCVVAANLDGRMQPGAVYEFQTPNRYEDLIDAIATRAEKLIRDAKIPTLGIGISAPGELDHATGEILMSPNLPMTNHTQPARELALRLGIETVLVHETDASCMAEQAWGAARGMDNIAIISTYEGLGASFVCDGRLLRGRRGLAGELGHTTVVPDGQLCGCGNRGCLETEATDSAFVRRYRERTGRSMEVEALVEAIRAGQVDARADLDETLKFLAIGIANVINLFDPEAVLVCSRMFDADPEAFARLEHFAMRRVLQPQAATCHIFRAAGDIRSGAVAAIIDHLTRSLGPKLRQGSY